jgi:hypothetical protein
MTCHTWGSSRDTREVEMREVVRFWQTYTLHQIPFGAPTQYTICHNVGMPCVAKVMPRMHTLQLTYTLRPLA